MAAVASLSALSMEELACVYSAAILADDDIPVTQEKLTTLIKAAEVEVEPIWPMLYARALTGVNLRNLMTKVGSCAMSAAAPGGGSSAGDAASPQQAAQAESKEESKPAEDSDEDSDDMGFGLFD